MLTGRDKSKPRRRVSMLVCANQVITRYNLKVRSHPKYFVVPKELLLLTSQSKGAYIHSIHPTVTPPYNLLQGVPKNVADRAKLGDWIFEPLWAIKVVLDRFWLIWAWSLVSQPSPQNSSSNFLWDTLYVRSSSTSIIPL